MAYDPAQHFTAKPDRHGGVRLQFRDNLGVGLRKRARDDDPDLPDGALRDDIRRTIYSFTVGGEANSRKSPRATSST